MIEILFTLFCAWLALFALATLTTWLDALRMIAKALKDPND